jgi:hypothetical protein
MIICTFHIYGSVDKYKNLQLGGKEQDSDETRIYIFLNEQGKG